MPAHSLSNSRIVAVGGVQYPFGRGRENSHAPIACYRIRMGFRRAPASIALGAFTGNLDFSAGRGKSQIGKLNSGRVIDLLGAHLLQGIEINIGIVVGHRLIDAAHAMAFMISAS